MSRNLSLPILSSAADAAAWLRQHTAILCTDSRKVQAIYSELLLPFTKQWQAQLSGRYDHYQQVGGALSPKIGLTYMPSKQVLLRASAGKGFRAPSMSDLHRPTAYSSTATLPDPVYCASENNDYSVCADNWDTRRYSNDKLKPERSRQFTAGLVLEPGQHWTFSFDYWNIQRTDLISEIGDDIILSNLGKYGNLVHRDEDNQIDYIELRKENRGAQKASGIDITADLHGVKTAWGRFLFCGTPARAKARASANLRHSAASVGNASNLGCRVRA